MLTAAQIKQANLIAGLVEDNLQPSTYDLSVYYVMDSAGKIHRGDDFHIAPLEIVWVVSEEILNLPSTVTCHTTLKNAVSRKGVLAINTGIIDPHFSGPISTALINFSKERVIIHKGDPILRLTFYEHEKTIEKRNMNFTHDQYRRILQEDVVTKFSPTFLNISELAKKIRDETITSFITKFGFWLSLVLLTVSLVTFGLTTFVAGQQLAN
jgi:deoxycytidine triphosphate deaminase